MSTFTIERKRYKSLKRRGQEIDVHRDVPEERMRHVLDEWVNDPLTLWIWLEVAK